MVLGLERARGLLDSGAVRIRDPRPLVREPCVGVFLQIHEYVAVSQPRRVEIGSRLDHLAQRCAGVLEASRRSQRPGKIGTRLPELRSRRDRPLQDLERGLYLVLGEQGGAQEPGAVHVPGGGRLKGSKLPLRAREAAGPKHGQCLS